MTLPADIKKTCVIGGSGFLGSHVCDELSDVGCDVTILDRVPSPWRRDDQDMIVGDILDIPALDRAIARCQAVYNFAALADLDEARRQPVETVRVNVLGNVQVLDACRRYGVRRYLYASTVYVHSREGGFYRCSKQAAEQYVEEYQRTYGLDYTLLRYGSLYGPRSGPQNGLWRIIKGALEASAMGSGGNVFHLDMGEPVRIADLAANMIRLSGFEPGRDIEIKFVGLRPGEKLYEELLIDGEEIQPTEHPRVRQVRTVDGGINAAWLESVRFSAETRDTTSLIEHICAAVPDYTPSDLVRQPATSQVP